MQSLLQRHEHGLASLKTGLSQLELRAIDLESADTEIALTLAREPGTRHATMTVGIVIVVWNGARWLADCIGSVIAQSTPPAVIVVVDNASTDESLRVVGSFEGEMARVGSRLIVLTQSFNRGFPAGANVGLRQCLAETPAVDVLALLNQDAMA